MERYFILSILSYLIFSKAILERKERVVREDGKGSTPNKISGLVLSYQLNS